MMDALQNLAFTKLDKLLSSIKKYIDKRGLTFIYDLLLLVYSQSESNSKHSIHNIQSRKNMSFIRSKKLIKALIDLIIFTRIKNSFMNRCFSKM